MHPYRADGTTATPGPTFEPCIDGLLSIPQKNRQPLSVVSTCFFHVIFVEAVFQKSYIFKSRLGFNAQALSIHHAAPFFPCSWPRGRSSASITRFTHVGGISGHTQAFEGQTVA